MYDDVAYLGLFVWNREKAEKNLKRHKIRFEDAARVFFDPYRVEEFDEENSDEEDRYYTTGFVGKPITVFWTPRGDYKRIFSARDANPIEEDMYEQSIRSFIGER
jgi:uncharacterized DUF497 family protein